MKKFFLFMIFATAIICSLMIFNAGAAQEGVAIGNAEDFMKLECENLTLADGEELPKFYLTNDIDFGGKEFDNCIIKKFSGTLDGNGFAIYNFKITGTDKQNADHGIFLQLMGLGNTKIVNLKVGKADAPIVFTPSDLASGKSHGLLAATTANKSEFRTTFEKVTVYGDITVPTVKGNAAGFVGYCRFADFIDCEMNGVVKYGDPALNGGEYMNTGGFIGANKNASTLTNCINRADIIVYASTVEARAAGLVAYGDGGDLTITGCKNYGNISALNYEDEQWGYFESNSFVAGILAEINNVTAYITNCENYGTLIGTNILGTMLGRTRNAKSIADLRGAVIKGCKNEGQTTKVEQILLADGNTGHNGAYGIADGATIELDVDYINNNTAEGIEYTTIYATEATTEYVDPTEPPDNTTDAPTEDPDNATTAAPVEVTTADTAVTEAPAKKSCGGFVGAAAVVAVVVSVIGCAIVIKKH